MQELEEYLRNNAEGILRYQYKLGYKEEQFKEIEQELPSLGSEESHMCIVYVEIEWRKIERVGVQ